MLPCETLAEKYRRKFTTPRCAQIRHNNASNHNSSDLCRLHPQLWLHQVSSLPQRSTLILRLIVRRHFPKLQMYDWSRIRIIHLRKRCCSRLRVRIVGYSTVHGPVVNAITGSATILGAPVVTAVTSACVLRQKSFATKLLASEDGFGSSLAGLLARKLPISVSFKFRVLQLIKNG